MNKTDQMMKWVVGFASAAALALGGWSFSTTANTSTNTQVLEVRTDSVERRLDRIEEKIDRLLERSFRR